MLREAGHEVTYLVTGVPPREATPLEDRAARWAETGVKVVSLPRPGPTIKHYIDETCTSYWTYKWLREHDDFDLVHFHEWRGIGYYSLLAKRQGLAFDRATLCVGTHGPSLWNKERNHHLIDHVVDLEVDYLERQSVALADVLISSSRYMLEWLSGRGWNLPSDRKIMPMPLPASALPGPARERGTRAAADIGRPVEEFVFYGRLEDGAGLALFCDALDRLAAGTSRPFRATFLGGDGHIEGQTGLDYIRRRSLLWPFPWGAITTLANDQVANYLSRPGRLAILPFSMGNTPLEVLHCLTAGIPFLASGVGGIPDLVDVADHPEVLFLPRPPALALRMQKALGVPARPARSAWDAEADRQAWLDWHDELARSRGPAPVIDASPAEAARPRVTVCLTHFNRPEYLRRALESLEAQDYPNYEVILVDDGSTQPAATAYVDALEPQFSARGWKVLRQDNLYPGAARNNAARHATGEYLLFMDDDNVAKPHEISRFIQVANRTGADILTCFMEIIETDEPIRDGQDPDGLTIFLGPSLAVAALYNCLGDTNALVRRDSFLALGGLTEDWGHNHEDKEFYARAIFQGLRMHVVPEALFLYRSSKDSLIKVSSDYLNSMRGLRPYCQNLPESVHQVVVYALAQFKRGLTPLEPPPSTDRAESAELPLRYRIADRINLLLKRIVPVHRVAKACLKLVLLVARSLKRIVRRARPVVSTQTAPKDGLPQPLSDLRGPHARPHDAATPRASRRA